MPQIINHFFHSYPQQLEVSNPYSCFVQVCQNESAVLKAAINLVCCFLEGQQLKQWVPVAQGEEKGSQIPVIAGQVMCLPVTLNFKIQFPQK